MLPIKQQKHQKKWPQQRNSQQRVMQALKRPHKNK